MCLWLCSLLVSRLCLASGPPPIITVQPLSQTVPLLGIVTFSVTASSGTTMTYQWYKDGAAIQLANSSSYTILSVLGSASGTYCVKVTNAGGSVTSSNAILSVLLPPTITRQPASQTTTQGLGAAFSVVASGAAPFSYQWFSSGAAISGATNAALALTNVQASDAGSYTVVVTNFLGAVTSAVATLTVYVPPTITTQPQSQGVAKGQDASFSVVPSGTTPFTYQWYFNGSKAGGKDSLSTLTLSSVDMGKAGNYTVVVVNPAGSVTSAVATLTVYILPGIQTQPQNQTVLQGAKVSFSVVTNNNGTPPFSYQWNINGTNSIDGPSISGSTNATLTLSNVQSAQAGNVFVVITNNAGSITSSVVTLTVNVPATITNQPQSQTVLQGKSASFSVGAMGTATLKYQWYCNGSSLSGATSQSTTLALSSVTTNNAGSYTVVVNNNYGSATSAVATLTVALPVAVANRPQSQTVTQGLNATFSVVPGGTPPFSYQWQYSGQNIPGATNTTLLVTNVQPNQAGNYQVTVANPWSAVTSAPAFLTVVLPPGSDRPTMQGLVAHLTFDADLTDSSGRGNHAAAVGSPNFVPGFIGTQAFNPFTQNGTNNYATFGTPSDLSFGATNDFSIAFWARLPTNAWSGSSYFEPPFICNKDFSTYANVGWTLAAGPGGRFEWNYSEGSASNYFGPGGTFGNPVWHHLAVTFHRGGSAIAYVDGVPVSTNSIAPGGRTIDTGLPTNIGNDGTGSYPAAYGYFTNVFGIPTNGPAMDDLGIWRRALLPAEIGAIYNAGLAGQDLSTVTTANLTTSVLPRITQQPVNSEALSGSAATFSISVSGSAPFGCQWFRNGIPITGANGASLTLPNAQPAQAGSYYVVLTNSAAGLTSAVATLTVNEPPSITAQPQGQALAAGQCASFSVVASGTAPLSYQWSLNGMALPGATGSTLTLNRVQTTDAGSYTVVVTNIAGPVTSAAATLTVTNPAIALALSSPGATTPAGFTFQFSVPVGLTYTILASTNLQDWTPISTNIALTGNVVFTDTDATNYSTRLYRVMVP
jgi:hypothetical protein